MTNPHLYVIKNKSNFTCRQNCMFFDDIKGECIAYKHTDYDNPQVTERCRSFQNIYDEKFDESMENKQMSAMEIALLDILSESQDVSNYPQKPSLDLSDEGFDWYVSPDNTFGCWIKNESTVPALIYSKNNKRPFNSIRYRSLIPLHDHACNDSLKNTIVWYVDSLGYGQYSLYFNGSVQQLHDLHF